MSIVTGTCNCNLIKFQIDLDKIKTIVNCHCNLCRGMNGSAFSTYAVVMENDFTMLSGNDNLKLYQATANAQKCFCISCGTPIYNINPTKYNGLKILYIGTLPDLRSFMPKANIYYESKLEWVDKLNAIESFAQVRVN
ncbi:MAG: aldehyde-activating protein [Burkholderiales bacterium]|jgi:hypothetical protein|nr:aldehyde-activating protein [Burkholderiales bacterium]